MESTHSRLLQLPAEIILQILDNLDPEEFTTVLLTHSHFRKTVIASRSSIISQLRKLPGYIILGASLTCSQQVAKGIDDNADLLGFVMAKACKCLKAYVVRAMDCELWRPTVQRDSRNTIFTKCIHPDDRNESHLLMATPSLHDGKVCIYHLNSEGVSFEHVIDPVVNPEGQGTNLPQVVRIAFRDEDHQPQLDCTKDIAILYSYSSDHVPYQSYWTFIYRVSRGYSGLDLLCKVRIESANDAPKMLYLSPQYTIVVTTKSHKVLKTDLPWVWSYISIWSYVRESTRTKQLTKSEETWTYSTSEFQDMLTDVSVDITKLDPRNSRCIDMRAKLFPTSMGRIWTLDELRVSSMPDSPLPETMGIFHQPAVGLILKDIHQCGLWDSDSEDGDNPDDTAIPHSYCCNTVLSICFSRKTTSDPRPIRDGVYLLYTTHLPNTCYPFREFEDTSNINHRYVAKFGGIDISNISTLGVKIAITDSGKRVAMANWNRLLVWAVAHEAFFHHCAEQYYIFPEMEDDFIVVLEPIELESKGVVYEMMFRGDDELWAWTDRGLAKWYFGPLCREIRSESSLEEV